MSEKTKGALRDLALLISVAIASTLLPPVAAHGILSLTKEDINHVLSGGAIAFLTWVMLVGTPVSRKYGVGADYRLDAPNAPASQGTPII